MRSPAGFRECTARRCTSAIRQSIGIVDLNRPDFGDAVEIRPGELPVFWACGVTPQLALQHARPELAITHSPGCMFVTDLPESAFDTAWVPAGTPG